MHEASLRTPAATSRRPGIAVRSAPELRAALQQTRKVEALDLRPLNRVLRLDPARGLLEVHAGARWEDVESWVATDPEARAAWTLATGRDWSTPATVGESIATNAPGYGPSRGPIADDVESLTLFTAGGELRRLSRNSESGLFLLVLGGHGLFGLLYSATLRLTAKGSALPADPAMPDLLASLAPCGEPCNAMLRTVVSLFIPTDRAGRYALLALEVANEHRMVVARASARRVIETEPAFLHPQPADRVEFCLELCRSANLGARVRMEEACRRLADLAIENGGGVSLSHGTCASRAQVDASCPMLPGFLAEKRRHDPAGLFDNTWSRHYSQLLRRESCALRWAA